MEDPKLTGYKAMYEFLLDYNSRGETEEISILLSSLSLLEDGQSADPALTQDWNNAYEKAKNNPDDNYKLKFVK
jgi:hypothetical protein